MGYRAKGKETMWVRAWGNGQNRRGGNERERISRNETLLLLV